MKQCVLFVAVVALNAFVAAPASGSPGLNYGRYINAAQCTPGPASRMVLNIVYDVTNDADSGFGGYWALDAYTKHIQVWDQGGGKFCVIARYDGSFVSVAGVSPSGDGTIDGGVAGTFQGGYTATITGATFAPGSNRTKGNIGLKDFGCSIVAGEAVGCDLFDWIGPYFTGASLDFEYSGAFQWGWIYHAGHHGTWVNANNGSFGDITGS